MNQERTENPTPRTLRKARERGERAFSKDFSIALFLTGVCVLLYTTLPEFYSRLKTVLKQGFSSLYQEDLSVSLKELIFPLIPSLMMIFFLLIMLSIGVHFLLGGISWGWKHRKRAGNTLSWHGVFAKLLFTLLKWGGLLGIGYVFYRKAPFSAFLTLFQTPEKKVFILFSFLFQVLLSCSVVFLFLGVVDLFYQRWAFYRRQRMTRQELKAEKREAEGDMRLKGKMREMSIFRLPDEK